MQIDYVKLTEAEDERRRAAHSARVDLMRSIWYGESRMAYDPDEIQSLRTWTRCLIQAVGGRMIVIRERWALIDTARGVHVLQFPTKDDITASEAVATVKGAICLS